MIRNGYARRLQAQVEQSRLTKQWQGYPQAVRQSLHAILRDYCLEAAQRATEVLVEYAASGETAKGGQERSTARRHGNLKGKYSSFPLRVDSQSLLPSEHYLMVDTDYEMIHLMQQGGFFLQSIRCNDVDLAIIFPLLAAWPAPTNYETLYASLCTTSWEGTFREFRRYLPALLNDCTQQLFRLGMEIAGNGSSLQLTSFA